MARNLGRQFTDERIRRILNRVDNIEDLRKISLMIFEHKVKQEEAFYLFMEKWNGMNREEAEKHLPAPLKPPQ